MRGPFQPQIFGKYFLAEKFATGGMAELYKAKTFGIDGFEKQIVIKRILPQWSGNAEFVQMLIDEAKLSVLLTHANIVQVHDLGKVDEDYYISMEYVHGLDLRKMLTVLQLKNENLPESLAVYIIGEVCRGLEYAHSKKDKKGRPLKIIHRDVNPPNILVSYEGEVKIGDFGIAKAAQNMSHTLAGTLKGKISYLSPEQASGQAIDHRADIFSTGAVLYELLTGQPLFTGETVFQILSKIRSTQFHENSFPSSIPKKLRTILAYALAFSVKDRYASASEMQIDLTRYLYSTLADFTPYQLSQYMSSKFPDQTRTESEELPDSVGSWIAGEKSASLLESTDITSPELIPDVVLKKKRSALRWIATLLPLLLIAGALFLYSMKTPRVTPQPMPPAIQKITTGILQIESDPPGAAILINGIDTALLSPNQIQGIELGKLQRLTLKKTNYQDLTENVVLLYPEALVLKLKLDKNLTASKEGAVSKSRAKTDKIDETGSTSTGHPIKRGFTKAGSSIKGFFGGNKEEEKKN